MAEAPARRFLTEHEDSRRWRNVVRRRGDVIVSAPPGVAATATRFLISRLLRSTRPGADADGRAHWVDDVAVPLPVLVESLERLPGRRLLVTRSPADAVPFDDQCHYVAVFGSAHGESASDSGIDAHLDDWRALTGVHDHLHSWWDRRHASNVLLLHASDMRRDPGSVVRRLANALHLSLSPSTRRDGERELLVRLSAQGDLTELVVSADSGAATMRSFTDAEAQQRWLAGGDRALGVRPEATGTRRSAPATGGFHPVYGRLHRVQAANTIDAITDRRVEEARRAGLFDDLALYGKPIPDIDRRRKPGWWADNFVAAEKHKVRALELDDELRAAMPALWRSPTEAAVRGRVLELNTSITEFNRASAAVPVRPLLDPDAIVTTWRRLRSTSRS